MNRKRALMKRKVDRSFKHTKKLHEYLDWIQAQYAKDSREFEINHVLSDCQKLVYETESKLNEIRSKI